MLSEILAVGLFGGEEDESTGFAEAVSLKLDKIALHRGAVTSWKLLRAERP